MDIFSLLSDIGFHRAPLLERGYNGGYGSGVVGRHIPTNFALNRKSGENMKEIKVTRQIPCAIQVARAEDFEFLSEGNTEIYVYLSPPEGSHTVGQSWKYAILEHGVVIGYNY